MKKLTRPFKRVWYELNAPSTPLDEDFESVWSSSTQEINQIWVAIRAMTTKGLAAGTIASLTLFGSQRLSGATPGILVFLVICIFLAGLLFLLIRSFLEIRNATINRKGAIQAVPDGDGYNAPPIILMAARLLDYLAVACLILGGGTALSLLYRLALTDPI